MRAVGQRVARGARLLLCLGLFSLLAMPGAPERRRTVLVVGIDGATWSVIHPLVQGGQLPTFARLLRRGAWGELSTLKPTISPAIWTTIATGYLPERHGISDFTVTIPGSGATTLPGTTERREPAFWTIASDGGLRVGLVNWWATFPAETVNGFVVSDRANLHRRFGYRALLGLSDPGLEKIGLGETHPASLLTRITGTLGDNQVLPPDARRLVLDPMPAATRLALEREPRIQRDRRLSVLKYVLLQDHAARVATRIALETGPRPDLLIAYFSGVDAAEHQFWAYFQPDRFTPRPPADEVRALGHVIPAYYRYMDGILAELLALMPRDALAVVVSDHGQVPNPNYQPDAPEAKYGTWSSGHHGDAPPGILLVSGPGVRPQKLGNVGVLDIAPTVLAALGLPATQGMPGRVIEEAFEPRVKAVLPFHRVARQGGAAVGKPPQPAEVDPELLEKLRALGYIGPGTPSPKP